MLPDKYIIDRFLGSDLFQFTNGGCHIFAMALCEYLPIEGYTMRAAFECRNEQRSLVHIYAYRDGFMIDALGVKREDDYLDHRAGSYGLRFIAEQIDAGELMIGTQKSKDHPPCDLNRWGLCVAPLFAEYLRTQAKMPIFIEPKRYCLSYLLEGQKRRAK